MTVVPPDASAPVAPVLDADDLDAFLALGAAWEGAPETGSDAERAVLGLARDALAHARAVGRRTHASALLVASPAGTVTVERVAATPEGLVRFEGQLHSRAAATVLVAPAALSVALAVKPMRDLRVSERDIGARILTDLSDGIAARLGAAKDAARREELTGEDAKRAKKAAKLEAKLARKAARAAPGGGGSGEGPGR